MLQMQLLYANKKLTKEKEYTCDYAQSHICILILLFIYYTPSTFVLLSFNTASIEARDNSTPIYIYSACPWGLAFDSSYESFLSFLN